MSSQPEVIYLRYGLTSTDVSRQLHIEVVGITKLMSGLQHFENTIEGRAVMILWILDTTAAR